MESMILDTLLFLKINNAHWNISEAQKAMSKAKQRDDVDC